MKGDRQAFLFGDGWLAGWLAEFLTVEVFNPILVGGGATFATVEVRRIATLTTPE